MTIDDGLSKISMSMTYMTSEYVLIIKTIFAVYLCIYRILHFMNDTVIILLRKKKLIEIYINMYTYING